MIENPQISFRVPEPLKDRLYQVAKDEMLTISDVCRRSVVREIQSLEEKYQHQRPLQWMVER